MLSCMGKKAETVAVQPVPAVRSAASIAAAAAAEAEHQRWLAMVAKREADGVLLRPRAARFEARYESRRTERSGSEPSPMAVSKRIRSSFWDENNQFGSTHSLRDLDECASPSLKEGLEEFDARPSGRPPRKSMSSPMLCALVSQPGARAGASRPTTPSLAAAPAPAMAPAKLPPDCATVAQAEVPLDVDALAGHRRQGGDLNDLVWPAQELPLDQQLTVMRLSLLGVVRDSTVSGGSTPESEKERGSSAPFRAAEDILLDSIGRPSAGPANAAAPIVPSSGKSPPLSPRRETQPHEGVLVDVLKERPRRTSHLAPNAALLQRAAAACVAPLPSPLRHSVPIPSIDPGRLLTPLSPLKPLTVGSVRLPVCDPRLVASLGAPLSVLGDTPSVTAQQRRHSALAMASCREEEAEQQRQSGGHDVWRDAPGSVNGDDDH